MRRSLQNLRQLRNMSRKCDKHASKKRPSATFIQPLDSTPGCLDNPLGQPSMDNFDQTAAECVLGDTRSRRDPEIRDPETRDLDMNRKDTFCNLKILRRPAKPSERLSSPVHGRLHDYPSVTLTSWARSCILCFETKGNHVRCMFPLTCSV